MARDTATYRGAQGRTSARTGAETWVGNGLAMIAAGAGIALAVIGMMVAFGYLHDGSPRPFQDGISWMALGLIAAVGANLFRREHHVVDETVDDRMNRANDIDAWAGNGLGAIIMGLGVAAAVIGLLVNFLVINDTNVNPFEDALIWFTGGLTLVAASLVCRRERPVGDTTRFLKRDDDMPEDRIVQDRMDVEPRDVPAPRTGTMRRDR